MQTSARYRKCVSPLVTALVVAFAAAPAAAAPNQARGATQSGYADTLSQTPDAPPDCKRKQDDPRCKDKKPY